MKMKKLTALLLAGLMAMSLVTSAFATTTDVEDVSKATNVAVTGTSVIPKIKLVVPNAAQVVLNPYAMKLTSTLTADTQDGSAGAQVVSAVYSIQNQSDVGMKVSVTATGKPATGVTLATRSVATTKGGNKQAYVVLEMVKLDAVPTDATGFTDTAIGQNKVILAAGTGVTLKTPVELAAGTGTALGSSGGVLAFRFNGDTSIEPTTAWKDTDKVDATLAFTFIPVTNVASTGG